MARSKPLININVPKAGRVIVTPNRIVGAAITGACIIAIWNWSSKIPGVGKYVDLGKYYVNRALGNSYVVKPVV